MIFILLYYIRAQKPTINSNKQHVFIYGILQVLIRL